MCQRYEGKPAQTDRRQQGSPRTAGVGPQPAGVCWRGTDWMRADSRERYQGWFSWSIQQTITQTQDYPSG